MTEQPISNPSVLDNPQTLQQWNNLLESMFGTPATNTNTTVTSGSAATDPIQQLLALLIPGATGGINNPQTQALLASIFTQFKEGAEGLSGIQAAGNSAGVYNSSTQGLMANDAMARAVAAAAGTVGDQQNKQQQIIANLLNTLMQGTRSTNTQQSQSRQGSVGSSAGKAALGAAAAKAAANAYKKATQGGSNYKGGEGRSDETDDTSAMGFKAGSMPEERGESVSGFYGEDKGMEWDSWDSGNSPEDSGWDFLDLTADPGAANGSWDFLDEGSGDAGWGETGESVSGFWGDDGGGGINDSGGFIGEPEFEDLGENF